MFNLEQSIAEWRQQMLAAGIKTPVPLEELESHLREDVEQQMRSGFSEQEAFGSAIKKIGQPRLLKTEFQKADCIGTFMKTYRILGVLWMALSGVTGTLFLFVLLHAVFTHPKVLFFPRFYLHTLNCLLYLAGGVAGFSLFHYAQWARKFVGLIAVLIMIVTIVQFVTYSFRSWASDIVSVLALVSVVLLLSERIAKGLGRKRADVA
jgi:lysylphosphatidylglycerol synthetase-like protein (DUF2156 family)